MGVFSLDVPETTLDPRFACRARRMYTSLPAAQDYEVSPGRVKLENERTLVEQ